MKKGENDCVKKRKRKSEETRSRKMQEVEGHENMDMSKDERNIAEAAAEENNDGRFGFKLKTKKRDVNKAGLVLGKRFTKEEDQIIVKAVMDYVEKHNLGEKGIEMVMNSSQHPNLRGCWNEISAGILPNRPQTSIYQRAQILCSLNHGKWTEEEIDYIKKTYKERGADWALMGKELGRHRIHVNGMYRFTKLPNLRKGPWSQDEYQALFDLVHADLEAKVVSGEKRLSKHGMLKDNICWDAISNKLGTRYQLRCCGRWYQRLSSPMVVDGMWADTDDYRMLFALVRLDSSCEEEVEWDSLIEHRTGDLCRKRWKQMVRDIGEHGSKSFAEQVEVLSRRYRPDMLQVREKLESRP